MITDAIGTIKAAYSEAGYTQEETGALVGRNKKLFNDRIVRNTLRYSEYFGIMDKLGFDVEYIKRETGKTVFPDGEDPLTFICDRENIPVSSAGKHISKSPKPFKERIASGLFRAWEFFQIVDKLGYDVKIVSRSTGKELHKPVERDWIAGNGRPCSGMVGGVKYDTSKADAIADDFYIDGENKFHNKRASELYRDGCGRYFLVDYTTYVGVKDRIIPLVSSDAEEYIELCSDKPNRKE